MHKHENPTRKDLSRIKVCKTPAWIREAWAAYMREYNRRRKAKQLATKG